MTAKEMFEKLGYLMKSKLNEVYLSYHKIIVTSVNGEIFEKHHVGIVFDVNDKWFEVYQNSNNPSKNKTTNKEIDLDLYHAITQQMKELGWIE